MRPASALAPLVSLAVALLAPATSGAQERAARDPRSVELLREDCVGALARQEITLFANGTIRLRFGEAEDPKMALHELGESALTGYLKRIDDLDLSDAESAPIAPSGEWTERCVLEVDRLDRPAASRDRFFYERFSSGSLAVERVRRILEDLLDDIRQSMASTEIPSTYKPVIGDRLERNDGELFEVVAFTLDNKGVELSGVDQPLTIFVEREHLRDLFKRIVPIQ